MFHFPAFPPPPYTRSDDGGPAQPGPGSPIRTPPDQSSLANSPGHIAGRNVLHQLLVPRHPPNAPQNHTQQKTRPRPPPQNGGPAGHTPPHAPRTRARRNKKGGRAQTTKMLATTIQITNNPPQPPQPQHTTRTRRKGRTQHTPTPKQEAAAPPNGGATGVGREPDSAPVRPQQQSPHAQPHNEDAPHQHTASRTHAPPSTAPPPAPTPRTKRTTRTNSQTAPQQGSLERR